MSFVAWFTVSTPVTIAAVLFKLLTNVSPLAQLPDGEYRYQHDQAIEQTILLRKVANRVVGVDLNADRACFQGTIQGNAIVQATYIQAPYTPDVQPQYPMAIDLDHYQLQPDPLSSIEQFALLTCVEVFSR